ncbi:MAG: hypothetical protein ACREP9_13900, partial [Candidatus Dormibacteraceae bacterium]
MIVLRRLYDIFKWGGPLRRRFGFCCLACLAAGIIGCQPAAVGNYRLERVQNDLILTPPPYWNRSRRRRVTLQFAAPARTRITATRDCTIHTGPFRFYQNSKQPSFWTAVLPSFDTWYESVKRDQFEGQFETLRGGIGDREARGCFSPRVAELLDEAARQSIPVRLADILLYQYSDEHGRGFTDLQPDMTVDIERAVFNSAGKFQGTDAAHYRITRSHQQTIQFHLIQFKSVNSLQAGLPDLELATV